MTQRKDKLVRTTAWLALAILILVLCGELACRAMDLGKSTYMQPDEQLGYQLIAGKQVEWNFEGHSRDPISSAGFRDIEHDKAKPAGVKRILILGDSVSEGLQVPLDKTLSRQLQHLLDEKSAGKIEVINASCSCYSLGQMALFYDRIASVYEPDEIFLLYGLGNAVGSIRSAGDMTAIGRPYFYMEKGVLLSDSTLVPPKSICRTAQFLLRHSSLANYLYHVDFAHRFSDSNYQGIRAFIISNIRVVLSRHSDYPPQDQSEVRNALLSLLNRVGGLKGARLTVFTLPSLGLKHFDDDYNEVKLLGAQQGFAVVDFNAAFAKGGRKAFLKFHLSEIGHEIMARRMYEYWEHIGSRVAAREAKHGPGGLPL